jgi:hypothetical protein
MVAYNLYSWLLPFLQANKLEDKGPEEPGERKNLYYCVPEFRDKAYS